MNRLAPLVHAPMFDRFRQLGRNIHNQCSTEGNVQKLVSAADCQQRFPLTKHLVNDQQLAKIAFTDRTLGVELDAGEPASSAGATNATAGESGRGLGVGSLKRGRS